MTGVERVYRDLLPDHGNVFFTHGDLALGNIILSTTIPGSSTKIAGIIDWEQAGWYPEYWEYCKLLYGVEYDHEWRAEGWANRLMKQFEDEWFAIAEYSLWRCPQFLGGSQDCLHKEIYLLNAADFNFSNHLIR